MINPDLTINDSNTDALLSELLSLARCEQTFPCCCVRAMHSWQIKKFQVDGATLAFPLRGTFRYREQDAWFCVPPGEMLILPNARSIDIACTPDSQSGEFIALTLFLTEDQLQAARLLLRALPPAETGKIAAEPLATFSAPLSRWAAFMRAGNRTLAIHAMLEIVIRLFEIGHYGLLRQQAPGIAMTIRAMVSDDPAHNWRTEDIEERLNISGATLRRRLAAEKTTLSVVITDARIADALQLLMTTRIPIKSVAARVGYASVASFSRQFSKRYGAEPSVFR